MHELSVAQNIIEIAESYIEPGSDSIVKAIRIILGEFSNILSEPLLFGFDIIKENTKVRYADLIIEEIPLVIRCSDCGSVSEPHEPAFFCPECSSLKIDVLSGMEMKITEIEFIDQESL